MMCAICRRDARGFGYAPALVRMDGPPRKLCSMRCMNITARLAGMIDPNKHEVNALAAASRILVGALGVLAVHYGYSRQKELVSTLSGRYDGAPFSEKGPP